MTSLPTLRLVAAVVAVSAVVAAIAIVRSNEDEDTDPATPPDSYATYEGEFEGRAFSFAYPESWGEVRVKEGSSDEEILVEVSSPDTPAGTAPSIRLGVQLDSASPEAVLQANIAAAQAGGTGLEVQDPEAVDVVGAVEALRGGATYDVGEPGGGEESFESAILVAGASDETIFSLIVSDSSTDPGLDTEAVLDSLRIEAADADAEEATNV